MRTQSTAEQQHDIESPGIKMANTSPHQLSLLADHLKLSLLERQRAISLNLPASNQDNHISRSLTTLSEGLETLEANEPSDTVSNLRSQYNDLYSQYHGSAPPSSTPQKPNNPALAQDFAAAQTRPIPPKRNKSVRFRDDPSEPPPDPLEAANRAALFSDNARYTDEPALPDQSELSSQQVHSYHQQVLRDQDDQLDTLGASIGRQRVLGIQMGNELDEQNELLTDVEAGVDRHQGTLDRARRRLGHVARKSRGNWSWITIAILICVLILLIIVLK